MRKLSGLIMPLLVSVVLTSCTVGEEDEPDPEPTAPPVSTTIPEPTTDASVGIPGTPEFDVEEDATPGMGAMEAVSTPAVSDEATPVDAMATPAREPLGTPEGLEMVTPAGSPVATPQVEASPAATPMGSSGMVVPPAAEPTATPMRVEMSGTVVLNGNENEAYMLTGEGCVGLGQYARLQAGQQVVVRDEGGTIIAVTMLEAAGDADGCAWEFWASVPESEFYAISVPMEFEQVFPKAMVAEDDGEVTIELP